MKKQKEKDAIIFIHGGYRLQLTGKQTEFSIERLPGGEGKPVSKLIFGIDLDYQSQLKLEIEEHHGAFAQVQSLLTDVETHRIDDPKLLELIEETSSVLQEWQKLFEAIELLREGGFDIPGPEA